MSGRIPFKSQWPNVLQKKLGDKYRIIQEGLCGRIAGNLQLSEEYYNGQLVYPAVLLSASPVDIVVIALGTNDCQNRYNQNANDVVRNLLWYKKATTSLLGDEVKVVYLLPANFRSSEGYFEANPSLRDEVVLKMSQSIGHFVQIDSAELTEDGVHYTGNDHSMVASAIYEKILGLGAGSSD